MKLKLLLLSLLLVAIAVQGQVNYKPGYIVLNNGDTLYTQISYLGGSKMFECVCYIDTNGIQTVLPAKKVIMYNRDGVEYRSFINSQNEKVFYKLIQTGCIQLYLCKITDTYINIYSGSTNSYTMSDVFNIEYILKRSNHTSPSLTKHNYESIVSGYIIDDAEVYNKFMEDKKFQNLEAVIDNYNKKHPIE